MTIALQARSTALEQAATAFHTKIDSYGKKITNQQFAALNLELEALNQSFCDILIRSHQHGSIGTHASNIVSALRDRITQLRPEFPLNASVNRLPEGCTTEARVEDAFGLVRQGTVMRRASLLEPKSASLT